jgi:hypothetical protein
MARPPIPDDTVAELMIKSGHYCCIHRGNFEDNSPLDIHHLDSNTENNNIDNLVPVCKNCHHGKIHNKSSFARHYTPEEITRLRNEWYELIKDHKKEAARKAVMQESLIEETEYESHSFELNAHFEDSQILYGKESRIILSLKNPTMFDMRLLSYQFDINYLFEYKLVHHISYSKRIWKIDPAVVHRHSNREIQFSKVNPSKYYFMSQNRGTWVARITIEYTHNEKSIHNVVSEADIQIR